MHIDEPTCEHPRDRTPEELSRLRDPRPGRQTLKVFVCGQSATEWYLPDGAKAVLCHLHGHRVIARIRRRLAVEQSAS